MTDALFAVIPTFGAGGPLAVLALLFPGVFGGALLLLRRWLTLLSVVSLNSTLYLLHYWLRGALWETWWGRPANLWLVMTLLTLAGMLWSWRRQSAALPDSGRPDRSEQITLGALSLVGLGGVLFTFRTPPDLSWKLLLVFAVGVWVGALHMLWSLWRRRGTPPVPSESVILGTMLAVFSCLSTTWPAPTAGVPGTEGDARAGRDGEGRRVARRWEFAAAERGLILGAPLVQGDSVYVTASHPLLGLGALYCLERQTGAKRWQFPTGGRMKPGFSAPCFWEGRIYFGEGWHRDHDCKLYCLDARSGELLWTFATTSHTESSPCASGGKIFSGAGDDGVYGVDARTGRKLWQYRGLHVDASPVVVGERLYCGGGADRDRPGAGETAVFCLDTGNGRELWKVRTELPAWGGAAVRGDRAYFALGNGGFFEDDPTPAGMLLCVEASTGRELWRFRTGNGILRNPQVDDAHVYFGCRDGFCYCLDLHAGTLHRKWDLGSPVLASPVPLACPLCGRTAGVLAVGSGGRVACLDPEGGRPFWEYDLSPRAPLCAGTPRAELLRTPAGDFRRIYLGAALGPASDEAAAVLCFEETLPRP